MSQAGFGVVLATDNNPFCAASYQANLPRCPFFAGSISDLDGKLVDTVTRGKASKGIDLLVGGPPCPPFSKSRFYRKNKPRALADRVGQETMDGYLRILRELRPRAFLMENVPGLAYKVHAGALDLVLSTAAALGYDCTWRILNAADYGVPQIRERFFLVGSRHGRFTFPPVTHCEAPRKSDLFVGIDTLIPWRTAGETINDLDTEENADDTGHFAGGRFNNLLRKVPPGENYLFFTKERGHPKPVFRWRSRYWSFLLKLSPDRPSWTIQARRSNNMGPFHWRNRILRIEEVKRLQTFPDEWKLCGKVEDQWRQIGNAVPPLLAYQLGRAIHAHLAETTEQFGSSDTRNGQNKPTRARRLSFTT
jgi:DNA (cytosine-5)-methyltransferase 1